MNDVKFTICVPTSSLDYFFSRPRHRGHIKDALKVYKENGYTIVQHFTTITS